MLEKLITGLSKTTDQQQFNTMAQSLLSYTIGKRWPIDYLSKGT
jgi:hypothetical protein